MFVSGPVIWSIHFLLVYLVTEAGCSGDGPGLRLFDLPVPKAFTLAATAAAPLPPSAAPRGGTGAGRRASTSRSPMRPPRSPVTPPTTTAGALAFTGFLLSLLSVVAILFVGLPALVLPSC